MTSVVLVDTGERVVECIAADKDPQLVRGTEAQAKAALQLLCALFPPYHCFPGCLAHVLHPSITLRRESVKWTRSLMDIL